MFTLDTPVVTPMGPATITKVFGKKWVKVAGVKKQWWEVTDLQLDSALAGHFAAQATAQHTTAKPPAKTFDTWGKPAKQIMSPDLDFDVLPAAPPATDELDADGLKSEWIAVHPGTLRVGDQVCAPSKHGGVKGRVVQLSGKAWAKLDIKPAWHKSTTLVREVRVKGSLQQFAPQTPDWSAWKKYWAGWAAGCTLTQRELIKNYTGSGYAQINKALRSGSTSHPVYAQIPPLDQALEAATLHHDVYLWRGGSQKFINTVNVGDIVQDPGYQSCSTDEKFASSWHKQGVLFRIRARTGQRGAYIASISMHPNEREYLLPRGTQYRVIERTTYAASGRVLLTVDIV